MNERIKQESKVGAATRWFYICADGWMFSAVAVTEAGAFRVLNAERPGMMARFVGQERA